MCSVPAAGAGQRDGIGHSWRVSGHARRCEIGGRFSRCKNAGTHVCQYCGRDFCADHALQVEAHEAICNRKTCARKRDDLAVHLVYRGRVGERNQVGLCGVEGCGPHPSFQCSLCKGYFCDAHLGERMYPTFDGYARVDRRVSTCPRCWERRKIWRSR